MLRNKLIIFLAASLVLNLVLILVLIFGIGRYVVPYNAPAARITLEEIFTWCGECKGGAALIPQTGGVQFHAVDPAVSFNVPRGVKYYIVDLEGNILEEGRGPKQLHNVRDIVFEPVDSKMPYKNLFKEKHRTNNLI